MISTIYYIQGDVTRLIKIGISTNVPARLAALQLGSPDHLTILALQNGSDYDEADVHRRFCGDRSHGEWFHPSAPLLHWIECSAYPVEEYYRRIYGAEFARFKK